MKKWFLNRLGLKLLSFVLAVVSWLAIRATINFELVAPDVPIEFRVSAGWAVLHQSDQSLSVVFKGSQDDIRQLDLKQIKAVIDMRAGVIAGSTNITVTARDIRGARNVRPVRIEPGHVRISFDRESEKKVPVKSRTIGKPYVGEVEALICDPAVVNLRGPARQLELTEWVYTEPVDVEGRTGGFTKRCRVLPPSDTWAPRIEPAEVQVRVVLTAKPGSRQWGDVPVQAVVGLPAPGRIEIIPSSVRVIVSGAEEALATLPDFAPRVFVDCADLDASLVYNNVPVRVYLPLGHALSATVEPETVRVLLAK